METYLHWFWGLVTFYKFNTHLRAVKKEEGVTGPGPRGILLGISWELLGHRILAGSFLHYNVT